MTFIFEQLFIKNNELIFYIFVGLMILIMLLTAVWIIKEIKNEYK